MRKVFILFLSVFLAGSVLAQSDTTIKNPLERFQPRSNDHFMLQLGYLTWMDAPDSIATSGLPRTFNAYFLFDFPFKTNPKMSAAIGVGFATDHMFFDQMYVGIKDPTQSVVFKDVSDTTHFKKYKLSTAYLEAPVELRFSSRPTENKKSIKAAVGVKVGTLLSAMVKGKDLQDSNDNTLNSYTSKEKSKKFFNQNRLSATARLGFGHYSLFGSYAITPLFKEGLGPQVRPMTIGLTISGL